MPSIGTTALVIPELLMVAAPLILLAVLFYVVRGAVNSGVKRAMGADEPQTFGAGDPSAEEVLQQHYAGGEITREQY
jgi:uncharacterized membrane protein